MASGDVFCQRINSCYFNFVRSNKSTGSSAGSSFGGASRKPSGKKSTAAGSSFSTQFSSTPEIRGHAGSMSTSTTDSSMFHVPDGVDLSAIGPPCLPQSFTGAYWGGGITGVDYAQKKIL